MNSSLVYLAQTDTTVGFLSSDDKKLSHTKKRDSKQKILQVVDSCKTLTQKTRIPKKFRSRVRRSKKTTFIYPNSFSYRVVPTDSNHHNFIKKFNCMYSTSANITKQNFDEQYAVQNSDIVLYTKDVFCETTSSSIYKLSLKNLKRIR